MNSSPGEWRAGDIGGVGFVAGRKEERLPQPKGDMGEKFQVKGKRSYSLSEAIVATYSAGAPLKANVKHLKEGLAHQTYSASHTEVRSKLRN